MGSEADEDGPRASSDGGETLSGAESPTWSADIVGSLQASRRAAWLLAAAAALLAVVEAAALANLFPLRARIPYTLTFDRRSGWISFVRGEPQNETYQLARYVILRESYDPAHPAEGAAAVLAMSAGGAAQSYRATLRQGVPDRARLFYQPATVVDVTVTGVRIIAPGLARVAFRTRRRDSGALAATGSWLARVAFAQSRGTSHVRALLVTYYQRDLAPAVPEQVVLSPDDPSPATP